LADARRDPPPGPPPIHPLNIILYGPPGTGKTYSVVDYCYAILNSTTLDNSPGNRRARKTYFDNAINTKHICFSTFHQSYSYEEFVEGISAIVNENIRYYIKDGVFKIICENARKNPQDKFVLVIDEINRGNISKIFGELITLIEESKRQGQDEALPVILPYSQDPLLVPNNLYIIGTMNTADRSLALMDTALRRRFDFIEMTPDLNVLNPVIVNGINVKRMLGAMNKRIEQLYDREHMLGHAFFMPLITDPTLDKLAKIFEWKIIPLLQEYFFEDWEKIRIVLCDDLHDNRKATQFVIKHDRNNRVSYALNKRALKFQDAYIKIYR
jgi:5-methylcytosine-specific restriction endonuclease McrBC GTP-binding regulatory subunit McrB